MAERSAPKSQGVSRTPDLARTLWRDASAKPAQSSMTHAAHA